MVKLSILKNTGAFEPEFFMYFEDTDLCAKIKKRGYLIQSVPTAKIIHLEGASFSTKTPQEIERSNAFKRKLYAESREIYYRRNLSPMRRKLANFFRKR